MKLMPSAKMIVLLALACLMLAPYARADTVNFVARLAGDELDAARLANAKGTASFALDTATKTLSWTIEYSGLPAPANAVRCGSLESQTGPALVINGDMKSPIKGSKPIADADISALSAGRWVCVLGTADDEAEIGGEVRPAR